MSDWRDGVERGHAVNPRRTIIAALVGSIVLWALIGAIVWALTRG